ncbi:recombinase family protein [Sporosarcina luteola]|uniref:recombinase family protein n=1 Tax=Sporosarcina luteola TaxID=582850 RepID=UPI001FE4EBC7|nr:recombinase family protein [Sporosarcina luteola]
MAIYIRVSTKLQEDRYSLKAQTTELTRYAESQNWKIIDIFKDVDSGTKLDKDGLEAMLDQVEDGKIDIVLCIEQDRLSRLDTIKWEYLKGVLRDNRVKIAEPGNIVDLSNEDDEFISDLKNLLAQRSRRDLLRKMMRGKRQKTREGKVWGKQPEEYHYNKETEEVTVNEERSWIIPFIDSLYIEKGLGANAIAKELNKISKTAEGKLWTNQQVLGKLKNPAYHGVLQKTFSNGETITVPGVYPPLRSELMYARIQNILKKRYRRKPAEPHFLRDVTIMCSTCQREISVKKHYTYSRDKTKKYGIFLLTHTNEITQSKCIAKPVINDKRVKYRIAKAVKDILTDTNKITEYIDSDFDETELFRIDADVKKLQKLDADVRTKMDKLLDLYLDDKWPKEKLDERYRMLEEQAKRIEADLKEKNRKRALIQSDKLNYDTVTEFFSIASRFEELLEPADQQRLIGSLFPTATLDTEKNRLTLHALLPQQVTVDVNIPIESIEEVTEREIMEQAKIRYIKAQQILNEQKGLSLEALSRLIGSQPTTLKWDQERFGAFKHLAPNKQSSAVRQQRVALLKEELRRDPAISGRQLENKTGINRKMIYKLIEEEGLKQ